MAVRGSMNYLAGITATGHGAWLVRAVDTEPSHLLVQSAPWNLEALQRRPDIAAGLQQTLPDCGALEVPDLRRQRKWAGVFGICLRVLSSALQRFHSGFILRAVRIWLAQHEPGRERQRPQGEVETLPIVMRSGEADLHPDVAPTLI